MARAIAHKRRHVRARPNPMRWVLPTVLGAVLFVGVLVLLNMNLGAAPQDVKVSTSKVWGQANAPVTIEIFSDFQCPVCARGDKLLGQIAPLYVDTGKAKVVYRHFAFIGTESQWAAQAAECAGEQNKFWAYGDYLFSHQAGENVGAFSRQNLKQFARQLSLDGNAFDACFDSGKYETVVRQETDLGRARGVQATPTFFFNGERLEGLLPQNQFTAMIDARLPSR